MEAHGRKRRKTKVQLCESGFQQVERYAGRTALNYTSTRCLASLPAECVCVLSILWASSESQLPP